MDVFFKEVLFFHSFCSTLFCLPTQCLHEQEEGVVKQKADRGREGVENQKNVPTSFLDDPKSEHQRVEYAIKEIKTRMGGGRKYRNASRIINLLDNP